ncbi:hypothetical protein P3X46_007249 [Hevea brasiliensis]|uniref:Aspartic peptidase DDI1-type domain-containing protein n=1 Tax=Hevea brasiliensis TaxID=3981 RepID=A0ABQ9MVF9_HEVBR|nr:hypothetical protein P3X46_007249 [Hevea brasiliensis]
MTQEKQDKEEPPIEIINVITGGPRGHKSSSKRVAEALSLKNVFSIDMEYMVRRVLIDTGSLVNLITLEVYEKLGLKRTDLTKVVFPLVRLGDKTVLVTRTINLIAILGNEVHKHTIYVEFIVVDIPLSYNAILGQPILNGNNILINMDYLCLKLLAPSGIAVVRGSQKLAQECYSWSTKAIRKATLPINLLEKPESNISPEPAD